MNATRLLARSMGVFAIMLVNFGCSREPPVAEVPPLEVVVSEPVIVDDLIDWDVYTGTVESKDSVNIRARVRGHIEDVLFREGQEIAENSDLFILDSEPFKADLKQAQGQLASWEAKLKLADERIALYKPLAEKGTISREELLAALASKGEAIGGIDTAKGKILEAQQNIAFCDIKSPIAGRVGEALLTKGNLANAGTGESLLATVVAVDPMYVKFNVNERALRNYQMVLRKSSEAAAKAEKADDKTKNKEPSDKKQEDTKKQKTNDNDGNDRNSNSEGEQAKLKIPVELALVGDEVFPYKGIVDFVDNRVDPATGSVMVRARFDNPKDSAGRRSLIAGMFARVRININASYKAILISDRAILTDQSLKYVLVVNKEKGNIVQRVDIVQADRVQADGLRAVVAGLTGDEWVIVEGVNRVRPGATVAPKEMPMPRRPIPGQ